ncbi:MAG: hypothetical protein AAF492_31730, partial [Verrucomicrobiota bacterium]
LYIVNYYARDVQGHISLPRKSHVIHGGFEEKAIVISGGETNHPDGAVIDAMSMNVYDTLNWRLFGHDDIRFLNHQTNNPLVDGPPSTQAIFNALADFSGADRLNIFLIGPTLSNRFYLGAGEFLDPEDLDGWLDAIQASHDIAINVIMDFRGSGSWLRGLQAPEDAERIVLASTRPNKPSFWFFGGEFSFMQFFMNHIFSGRSIGESFEHAERAIIDVTGGRIGLFNAGNVFRQEPRLDETGDGGHDVNLHLAPFRYIGPAFVTADDPPLIGSIMPDADITYTNEVILWVGDVMDVDGISNVTCIVTPPSPLFGTNPLFEAEMTYNPSMNRYEFLYTNLLATNRNHQVTFVAVDNN